jgi:hypothetical protein
VVAQDLGELALVLGLEQRVDRAGLVGGREHGEGAFARQRIDEVGSITAATSVV